MAIDEVFRLAFRGSDGLVVIINILGSSDSQVGDLLPLSACWSSRIHQIFCDVVKLVTACSLGDLF